MKILSIIPATEGWRLLAHEEYTDVRGNFPVACWALVENDGVRSVLPMLAGGRGLMFWPEALGGEVSYEEPSDE